MSTLLGPLETVNPDHWISDFSEGPNKVVINVLSPEDRNRSSFRNVELYSYLEFRTMDEVLEPLPIDEPNAIS
jgi:hypothetical protein